MNKTCHSALSENSNLTSFLSHYDFLHECSCPVLADTFQKFQKVQTSGLTAQYDNQRMSLESPQSLIILIIYSFININANHLPWYLFLDSAKNIFLENMSWTSIFQSASFLRLLLLKFFCCAVLFLQSPCCWVLSLNPVGKLLNTEVTKNFCSFWFLKK